MATASTLDTQHDSSRQATADRHGPYPPALDFTRMPPRFELKKQVTK